MWENTDQKNSEYRHFLRSEHGHRWFHSSSNTVASEKDLHYQQNRKNWCKYCHLISSDLEIFSFSDRYSEWIDGTNFLQGSENSSGDYTTNWLNLNFLKMTFFTLPLFHPLGLYRGIFHCAVLCPIVGGSNWKFLGKKPSSSFDYYKRMT